MLVLAGALSIVIGLCLGLLGAGGGILMIPMLTYVVGLEPKRAIATSLVVVTVTSALAMTQHARAGHVRFKTGLVFSAAGMMAAYLGGRVASGLPGPLLLLGLALLMLVSATLMLRGKTPESPRPMSLPRGVAVGILVGFVAGMVGSGGGFIIVPALVVFGGMKLADAIGTSLLVIAMQSLAAAAGHLAHTSVDLRLVAVVTGCAVVGSLIGSRLSRRTPPKTLRTAFALLVAITGVVTIVREILALRGA